MEVSPLGPLMFVVVLALIFLGFPVAFCLGGAALIFGVLGVEAGEFAWDYLKLFPERVLGVMGNQVLLAVPFFIFMSTMLERSRLAQDLLRTIGLLFGSVRGGLAFAVVFVGALLAASTGVVGASVVSMGLISLPVMMRYGYAPSIATGVICASGTLGQIIPPSIVLVVLGDQMGVSVGDLFRGSIGPGLLLTGLYAAYIALVARFRPEAVPAIPVDERAAVHNLWREVLRVMVPPLVLILVVLGSIFVGIATPTEAGALGAVGAMALAWVSKRLTRTALRETVRATTSLTAMVVVLLIGSTAFTLVFRGLHGDDWIKGILTSLPGGVVGLLVVANIAVFVLGFFIDFFEIAFIVVPLLVPAARALGLVDNLMVWFGVILAVNLQTSFLTPPFGFSLFYLRGVAPKSISTGAIYRGAVPFILIQLIGLLLIIFIPEIVTWALPAKP